MRVKTLSLTQFRNYDQAVITPGKGFEITYTIPFMELNRFYHTAPLSGGSYVLTCKANGLGYYYGPQSIAYTSCFLL